MLDRLAETSGIASFRSFLLATVDSMTALVPAVPEWRDPTSRRHVIASGPVTCGRFDGDRLADRNAHDLEARIEGEQEVDGSCSADHRGCGDRGRRPWRLARGEDLRKLLDLVLRADCYELSTSDGMVYVAFANLLPDTVTAAVEGRALIKVLGIPLCGSRGFIVKRAAQVGNCTSLASLSGGQRWKRHGASDARDSSKRKKYEEVAV